MTSGHIVADRVGNVAGHIRIFLNQRQDLSQQWIVRITPLYQGVDLIRSLAVGYISPVLLVHVAYLTVMGLIGLVITNRRLGKLLLK